jgi:hypothetical protein
MKIPTIHLGGTPADRLIEQYTEAFVHAEELLRALADVDLNARDYYMQAGDAFEQARRESIARYEAVKNIRNEMQDFIIAIQTQLEAR